MSEKPSCIVVYGPTASGKSAYALRLAQECNGIVINADVMQLYSPFPVLTAQPTEEEKHGTPHALYGVLPPDQWCNAHKWRSMACGEIERAYTRGQTPIITGGTGFYILALMKGLAKMPAVPGEIRKTITERLANEGHEKLHSELQAVDKKSAAKIKINDTQRLIRALEMFYATNIPLSEWQNMSQGEPAPYDFSVHLLLPERDIVYSNINHRVTYMIENGALDEVKNHMDCLADWPVYKSHGFREFKDYLEGQISLEEAVEKTRQVTRHYAKRQMTWARHQMNAEKLQSPVKIIESIQ